MSEERNAIPLIITGICSIIGTVVFKPLPTRLFKDLKVTGVINMLIDI